MQQKYIEALEQVAVAGEALARAEALLRQLIDSPFQKKGPKARVFTAEEMKQARHIYQNGGSMQCVADLLDTSITVVRREFLLAGISVRGRGRGGRKKRVLRAQTDSASYAASGGASWPVPTPAGYRAPGTDLRTPAP